MWSYVKRAWKAWLRFAHVFGTVQMVIVLSVVYWVLLIWVALPSRLISDPLALRNPRQAKWLERQPVSNVLDAMKMQG